MKRRKLKFKTSYLEYYKGILGKVSFCNKLFQKEYRKAKKMVETEELISLNEWIKQHTSNNVTNKVA